MCWPQCHVDFFNRFIIILGLTMDPGRSREISSIRVGTNAFVALGNLILAFLASAASTLGKLSAKEPNDKKQARV